MENVTNKEIKTIKDLRKVLDQYPDDTKVNIYYWELNWGDNYDDIASTEYNKDSKTLTLSVR